MIQPDLQNEIMKRRYRAWLREGRGYAETTVTEAMYSIDSWEQHIKRADFRSLKIETIKTFKQSLEITVSARTKKPISLRSQHHQLLDVAEFYRWLALQRNYKSKINLSDLAYFSLDRKKLQMARQRPPKRVPTVEIVARVVRSITGTDKFSLRDRALIAFALLSGMRIGAILTLPLGCFDSVALRITQDPKRGVHTKFGKLIVTTMFTFDDELVEIVKTWVKYLREQELFTDADPLFPPSKIACAPGSFCFEQVGFEHRFWRGTRAAREIFKARFAAAGLEYFSPHKFRSAAVNRALALCKTPQDFKAISQNLGHEDMETTMFIYAELPPEEVERRVRDLTKDADMDEDATRLFIDMAKKLFRRSQADNENK